MKLYKNKFRVESTRLKEWDYSTNAYYFITLCTKGKKCFFGDLKNGKPVYSEIGEIVTDEWLKTEKMRPGIVLDEWVLMPNHLHGIIIINNENNSNVETHSSASQQLKATNPNKPPQQKRRNNLSNIIKGFKSAATKRIHIAGYRDFSWQARFYDHIIRNEKSLFYIRKYIKYNPLKWELDNANPVNF